MMDCVGWSLFILTLLVVALWLLNLALPFVKASVQIIYKVFADSLRNALGRMFGCATQYLFRAKIFGKVVAAGLLVAAVALFAAIIASPYLLHYGIDPMRLWELLAPAMLLASILFWCRHYYRVLLLAEERGWVKQKSAASFGHFLKGVFWSAVATMATAICRAAISPRIPPIWPLVLTGFALKAALEWKRSMEHGSIGKGFDLKRGFRDDPAGTKSAVFRHYELERASRKAASRWSQ
jgi:hypothetical protein